MHDDASLDDLDASLNVKAVPPLPRGSVKLPALHPSLEGAREVALAGVRRPTGSLRRPAPNNQPVHSDSRPHGEDSQAVSAAVGAQAFSDTQDSDEAHKQERQIDRLFSDCEAAAYSFQNSKVRGDAVLIECLRKAALLHAHGKLVDPDGYARLLSEHRIKETARTHNPFTPVVKLVFHALDKRERTSLSRHASVLRYADQNEIWPDEFDSLLKEKGGIAGCVKKDRENNPSPERQAAAKKRANHLQMLRAQPSVSNIKAAVKKTEGTLLAVLVERDMRGNIRILGCRKEELDNAHLYKAPLEKP